MIYDLNRTLIETMIRCAIKKLKDDPERSVRNLVDMALSFSGGESQQSFFEAIQRMLEDESSAYYRLIQDFVANTDGERLVSFGMNIGYNSCMAGVKKIREVGMRDHIKIPWSISLEMSGEDYVRHAQGYHSLIAQGEELGIYTWMLYVPDHPERVLELIEAFPQCAFIMICSPSDITPALLDEADTIDHLMFVVEYRDNVEEACALLRSRKFLYSVCFDGQEGLREEILHEMLCDAESRHSAFTFLFSIASGEDAGSDIYGQILKMRAEQRYRTIPIDIVYDNDRINEVILQDSSFIFFTKQGEAYTFADQMLHEDQNFFQKTLHEILQELT